MARKRNPKQTEKPTATLRELPRETEELTGEEAEATKGGNVDLYYASLSPEQRAQAAAIMSRQR